MAREKRAAWFKVFLAQKPTIDAADDISVGKALKAALQYFDTGEIAALEPMPRVIFAGLKGSVDEAVADYEASVRNGRAGGAKRWENTHPIPPLPPLSPLDTPPVGCDAEAEAEAEADIINAKNARSELGMSTTDYLYYYEKYGSSVMSGSGFEKTQRMLKAGFSVEDRVDMKNNIDADKNDSVSQSEARKYLDSRGYTRAQKADLWIIINKGWKKNPYN